MQQQIHNSKVISGLMDLTTMKIKIDRKSYQSLVDFDQDVSLMLRNCLLQFCHEERNPPKKSPSIVVDTKQAAQVIGFLNRLVSFALIFFYCRLRRRLPSLGTSLVRIWRRSSPAMTPKRFTRSPLLLLLLLFLRPKETEKKKMKQRLKLKEMSLSL